MEVEKIALIMAAIIALCVTILIRELIKVIGNNCRQNAKEKNELEKLKTQHKLDLEKMKCRNEYESKAERDKAVYSSIKVLFEKNKN